MTYRQQDPPPEFDRSILLVGLNGQLVGLDRDSGEIRWENPLGRSGGEVFVAIRYGLVVASPPTSVIYRVDYATGETLWQAQATGGGQTTILIEPDCIVVGKAGYLDCFDHDGRKLWAQPLEGKGIGSVALGYPGNVAQADS
jgi:outer membrane protein assembly factor BamB